MEVIQVNNKLEIRLLPMSQDEFENKTINEIQNEYFLDSLINNQDGRYHYPKVGMTTTNGSLILFQYCGHIIASAELITIEDYKDRPVDSYYTKAYVFDKNSIRVFEPITKEELSSIVDTFTSFNQSKQVIDYKYYNEINELMYKKSILWEEQNAKPSSAKYIGNEGVVKWGIQSRYERDSKVRSECINYYGSVCQICGFDFEKEYGEMGKGFIHVHHRDKLANSNGNHSVDPIKDVTPVCPNCHAMLHNTYYGKELTIEELKEILTERKDKVNV